MKQNQDLSLPEKIEGKEVTVDEPEEKTQEEKERIEKQKEFEYLEKSSTPEQEAQEKKQSFRDTLLKWALLFLVTIGVVLLGIFLL